MDDGEVIKPNVILFTTSEKLQTTIIQKEIDLTKVIAKAKLMEMAQQEVNLRKNYTLQESIHEHRLDSMLNQKHQRYQHVYRTATYSTSATQVASRVP